MTFFRITASVLAFAIISIQTTPTFAQRETASKTIIRISVDLVQVDAVVVDSEGNPITDLKAKDFDIFQDGKKQNITAFSFIKTRNPEPNVIVAGERSKNAEDTPPLPPPPPTPLKPENIRRTIALVVDDLALSFDSIVRVRQALKRWVDTEMQPGDLVAVIRTGVGISALQQFTNDKRVLYAAIDRIRFSMVASRIGTTSFTPKSSLGMEEGAVNTDKFRMGNVRLSTLASMRTIQYIADGLKDIPGRKGLIIFSESLPSDFSYTGNKSNQDSEELSMGKSNLEIFGQNRGEPVVGKQVRGLIEAANRSTVVIHVIDPRGVVHTGITAEDDLSLMSAQEMSEMDGNRWQELVSSQDNMARLAKETGGLFIRNTNDLAGGLKKAVDDGNGYYLIGYQPDAKTIEEMKEGSPKLHTIRVRVNRPGLRVRSRSRFFSVPSKEDAISKPRSQQERIDQALESPFTHETLPVRLTPLFFEAGEEKPHINALIHFDAHKLKFSRIENGWREAVVDIVAATLDADGKQADIAYKRGVIQVKGKTYENIQKNGIAFLMHVAVKKPGSYLMRVVLYDNESGQLGSATQFVDVPDIRKEELALSGIVLASDRLQPKAFSQAEGVIAYENTNGSAAVRIFKPGETIAWACQILNAKLGKDRKPQLKLQVRLFHEGREIYPGKPIVMGTEALSDKSRIIATGRMELKNLASGSYVLQVIVFDMLAKKNRQVAVQSMDFAVQNPQDKS